MCIESKRDVGSSRDREQKPSVIVCRRRIVCEDVANLMGVATEEDFPADGRGVNRLTDPRLKDGAGMRFFFQINEKRLIYVHTWN